jgi:LDH2 family malate/lactate/ureidoglycolate dehydrogenase
MDMAPTVAAFGKVRLKAALGEPMPVGWSSGSWRGPSTAPRSAAASSIF